MAGSVCGWNSGKKQLKISRLVSVMRFLFLQAVSGRRVAQGSRGLGDVYKNQEQYRISPCGGGKTSLDGMFAKGE